MGHPIVSAPRHTSELIADDNQRNVTILLENGGCFRLKVGAGGDARYILDGVVIKKVHKVSEKTLNIEGLCVP